MPQTTIATTSTLRPHSSAKGDELVEGLFRRLLGFYGAKWLDMWRGAASMDEVRAVWREELRAAGITRAEFDAGVDACRTREWPPTLPEFLKLCRPTVDPAAAWYAAQAGIRARARGEVGFADPVLFEAARALATELRNSEPYAKHADRWRFELAEAAAAHRRSPLDLPRPPPVELPAPPATSREEAAKRIAEIRARIGGGALRMKIAPSTTTDESKQ